MSISTGYRNLVGGEWVDAADGGTMEVLRRIELALTSLTRGER